MTTQHIPLLFQTIFYFYVGLITTVRGSDIPDGRIRSAARYANGGPQCKSNAVTATEGQCNFVCEAVWEQEALTQFLRCSDPMSCFTSYWQGTELENLSQVDTSLISRLRNQCSFVTRPSYSPVAQYSGYQEYTLDQLEASAVFGGERLCKSQELKVVDFLVGHADAFLGQDKSCSLYSIADEIKAACEDDKERNKRLFCELGSLDLPTVPELSELCSSPPSLGYRFSLFYDCILPSNSLFACDVTMTTSWDASSHSCKCPSNGSACTLQEARFSEAWQKDLPSTAVVYLAGSIRFMAHANVYNAFKYVLSPCRNASAQALCKRNLPLTTPSENPQRRDLGDMGPNCYKGNDQPFCRVICLLLWPEFRTKEQAHNSYDLFTSFWDNYDLSKNSFVDSNAVSRLKACKFDKRWDYQSEDQCEYEKIVDKGKNNTLPLENNCEYYEKWDLIKVVYGSKEALTEGNGINGCSEVDITDFVGKVLPKTFLNGTMRSFEVPLDGFQPAVGTCPEENMAYFIGWNCFPNMLMSKDTLPISCNLYRPTGALDVTHHSCACPNSTRPCNFSAGTVSEKWISDSPPQATIMLADYISYKTSASGSGSVVVVDDLSSICKEGVESYVLCEDIPEDIGLESIPPRDPACKAAFSILEGATDEDDKKCITSCNTQLVGACANATNTWLCVASALKDCYVPNTDSISCHIELPGPKDESNGTCRCSASSLGPCTSMEAIATGFFWKNTLSQFIGESNGVIMARNLRALWPASPASWHYEAGPLKGKCEQNNWIKGVFCRGQDTDLLYEREGPRAPKCRTAISINFKKASTFQCQYMCGNVEWRCRTTMVENPTMYKDIMECFRNLKTNTLLEFCDIETIPQTPTAGAANVAVSWMLASGTESQIRFAKPVNPTPIVFIGAPQPIAGIPKFSISQVTSEGFTVKVFGAMCGVRAAAASTDLKVVASYLALPPGQYVTKHSTLRLVVGSFSATTAGDILVRIPFSLLDPSKAVVLLEPQSATGQSPGTITATASFSISAINKDDITIRFSCSESFVSITVGYLIADLLGRGSTSSALAASLGGRSLAVMDSREVDINSIAFPSNLPSFFVPHFFPQLAREGSARKETYSVQWQSNEGGQTWTPSVWISKCNSVEEVVTKVPNSEVNFTGLYIAATAQMSEASVSSSICNIKSVQGGSKSEDDCARLCSGIHLLYCSSSANPFACVQSLLPSDFAADCTSPSDNGLSVSNSDTEDVDGIQERVGNVKCRVFDMRNYPSNLAWDSLTFTCSCPGHYPACSTNDAANDLTWLKLLQDDGGLCNTAKEAVKPVTQSFFQLSQDACLLETAHDPSLTWTKRAYPVYPDLPGPGSGPESHSGTYLCQLHTPYVLCPENAAEEESSSDSVQAPQVPPLPNSCFAGEWGEWSACDATCLGADFLPKRSRRRSPLFPSGMTDGAQCVLEESEDCGDTLELCTSYCWTADWTNWSQCTTVLADGQVQSARRRNKPVFAGAEFCNPDEIQEIRPCFSGSANGTNQVNGSEHGFAEVSSLVLSRGESSEWSGCDVPCLVSTGHNAVKRKLQHNRDGSFSAIHYGTNSPTPCTTADDGLVDCNADFDIQCDEVVPTFQSPEAVGACKEKCENAREKCTKLVSEDALATPYKTCLLSQFSQPEFYSFCRFSGRQRLTWRASCRPTFTRIINPHSLHSFLTYSPDEKQTAGGSAGDTLGVPSCSCLGHGLEPCTAKDIVEDWKGIRDSLLSFEGLCSTKKAKTPLWSTDENSRLPDSSIFFAFSGMGRFHCPMHGYKKISTGVEEHFTFTSFSSASNLNTFCESGLDYWEDGKNPLVYSEVPDCSKAVGKKPNGLEPSNEETQTCQELCISLQSSCTTKAAGVTYDQCFLDVFQKSLFSETCTFTAGSARGKGIIFCKEKEPKCELTEWSEWSQCSVSCVTSRGKIGSAVRIRSREVLEEGKVSAACREWSLFGTVQIDACPVTPLCHSSSRHGPFELVTFTTKAPPLFASWSPDSPPTTPSHTDFDFIPDDVTPQLCHVLKVDVLGNERSYDESSHSCSCPKGYRPCYRGEAVLSPASWVKDAYSICVKTSNNIIGARNFQEFSCVSWMFVSTNASEEQSSKEEKAAFCSKVKYMFCAVDGNGLEEERYLLLFVMSLSLGALAGIAVAYFFLQYSIDLQKLVGLRGRYAEVSVELKHIKEG